MTQEELKIIYKIYGAMRCIHDLTYYSGKHDKHNELKFALGLISELIISEESNVKNTNLKEIAKQKIDSGMDYKQWVNLCKHAILDASLEKTKNLSRACKLIKCHRETFYRLKTIHRRKNEEEW